MEIGLSFLGTGNYKETDYRYGKLSFRTKLFPTALPTFCPELAEVRIFVTDEAREKWLPELQALWVEHRYSSKIVPVRIPPGADEEELWVIFEKIVESVPEDSSIVFDITHSFRSLPMISLLAVAYLKSARRANLKHLLYGAFEARDDQCNSTPVFDLTPMVSLLDWLSAYERLFYSLDGSGLADLLNKIQNNAYKGKRRNPPEQLKKLGQALTDFAGSLNLGRVQHTLDLVPRILQYSSNESLLEETESWARPLKQVLPLVSSVLHQIAERGDDELDTHWRLAHLYYDKGFYLQSISLIREWIVSRFCREYDPHARIFDRDIRKNAEDGLNHIANQKAKRGNTGEEPPLPSIDRTTLDRYAAFWGKVRDTRNDALHLGFNKGANDTKTIEAKIKDYLQQKLEFDSTETGQ